MRRGGRGLLPDEPEAIRLLRRFDTRLRTLFPLKELRDPPAGVERAADGSLRIPPITRSHVDVVAVFGPLPSTADVVTLTEACEAECWSWSGVVLTGAPLRP